MKRGRRGTGRGKWWSNGRGKLWGGGRPDAGRRFGGRWKNFGKERDLNSAGNEMGFRGA